MKKEHGGPDIWNVSYPACTPFLPWPRPAAPHHSTPVGAVLKGCHGVTGNRPCLGRLPSCRLFPTNLTAQRATPWSACANPLLTHGEAQLWAGAPVRVWDRFISPH